MVRLAAAGAALFAGLPWPAHGQAAAPCDGRYTRPTTLHVFEALGTPGEPRRALARLWGRDNISPLPHDATGLRLRYPRGSINPGHPAAPLGGAGFLWATQAPPEARCLSYRVRMSEGFAFARGGKLPGLFGGSAPAGCAAAAAGDGFSARLMWRAGGLGELYLYAPDRSLPCGASLGRGSFRLTPGQWAEISQEVVLNRPGEADGVIRLWIDGRRVLEQGGLTLRATSGTRVDGMMFSSFFGGADPGWASPRDQMAEFSAMTLWGPAPPRPAR